MVLELLEGEEETPAHLLSPPCGDTVGRQLCASQKGLPMGTKSAGTLTLGFSPPELQEITVLRLSPWCAIFHHGSS